MANNMTEELTGHKDYTDAREEVYGTDGKVQSGYHHGPVRRRNMDTHAKNMETRKNVNAVKKAGKAVHASKYDKLNHMTIDQLAAARAILQKKMAEQKITKDKNPVLFEKFTSLNNEYINTQQQIDKYYVALSNNPLTKTLIQGKRHMLTIAYIKGGKLKPKGKKEGYTMLDEIKRYKPLQSMAIAGLVTAGLAGIGFIPGVDFSSFTKMLIDFFFKNKTNPLAAKILFAGLAVAAGAMATKGVYSAVKRYKRNKAAVNNMNYEMDKASLDEREKEEEAQRKKEEEERKTFMANMDDPEKLYKAYKNDPSMVKELTRWVKHPNCKEFQALTSSQKLAVAKAVQKWLLDEKEANKTVEEANKDDATKENEAKAAEQQKVLDDFKPLLRGDSAEVVTNYMKDHVEQLPDLLKMLKDEVKNNPTNNVAREALGNYNQAVKDARTPEETKLHDTAMKEFDGLLLGDSSDAIVDYIRKNPDYTAEFVTKLAKEAGRKINNVANEAYAKYQGMATLDNNINIPTVYANARKTNDPKVFYEYYVAHIGSGDHAKTMVDFLQKKANEGDAYASKVIGLVSGAKKEANKDFVAKNPDVVSSFRSVISCAESSDSLEHIKTNIKNDKTLTDEEKQGLITDLEFSLERIRMTEAKVNAAKAEADKLRADNDRLRAAAAPSNE